MDFSFDKCANALYKRISKESINETEEIREGILLDYDEEENIMGIEILNFSHRNLDLNELIRLEIDEIIPKIVQFK